jgi:preprotein translocase subunit SecE
VADKPVKTKQPEKLKTDDNRAKEIVKAKQPEKAKAVQTKAPEKDKDKDKEKSQPRQPNRVVRWYRETIGELRKVSWPTPQDAWRLTKIVLMVMLATSLVLGVLDLVFSRLVGLLVQI